MKRLGGILGILVLAGLGQASTLPAAAPQGLQAEYSFAESTGVTAGDSSGNDRHASLQNGVVWAPGRVGGGVSFDGVNDFVTLGDNRPFAQSVSAATLGLWIKPGASVPSGAFRELVSLSVGSSTPSNTSRLALSLKGTAGGDQVFFGARSTDTEGQKSVTTIGTVAPGTWTHLAGVVDYQSATLTVYINGSVVATATAVGFSSPTTPNTPSRSCALGAQDTGSGNHFQGGMDAVRIYNRALSAVEVGALASGDVLQAHWKLDDGAGLVASDASGNSHTGALQNGLDSGWVLGQVGGALRFDGVDDHLQVTAPGLLRNANAATVAAWIKPSSSIPAAGFRELVSVSVGGAPSNVSRFALALRDDGTSAGDVFLGGRSADGESQKTTLLATIKDKLESMEVERAEMEATQARLKAELEAEESQEIAVDAHVASLAIFEALVQEHGDEPERIKSAITRFVDYVVWHGGQKGEGQLEVSLFAHPVALSPDMIDYDSALHGAGRCFVPESEMVGLRLLPTKQPPLPLGRPLRDITPYYSRSVDRRKEFVLGPKPGLLKGLGSIDKKVWTQYQTHLGRTTPLERAEFYAREMKERRMRSFRALSLLLGEPVNRVGRYMKLLDLPEPIKEFLRQHREPEYLRYFTERQLQELVRLGDSRAAWRRFQAMVREAELDAGIWRNNGQ